MLLRCTVLCCLYSTLIGAVGRVASIGSYAFSHPLLLSRPLTHPAFALPHHLLSLQLSRPPVAPIPASLDVIRIATRPSSVPALIPIHRSFDLNIHLLGCDPLAANSTNTRQHSYSLAFELLHRRLWSALISMSSLLSFARAGPSHRAAHDEEAGVASPSSQPSSSRWSRPFGLGSSSANRNEGAVEMNSQASASATQPAASNANLDIEQGAVHHERGTSGRSFLSAVSIPSLSNLRQRDRDQERRRQNDRAQAEGSTGQSRSLPSFVGGGNPLAAVMLPVGTQNNTFTSRSANKKSRSSKREREEAATLFGPNLANYFGSGISSSGAVSSHAAGVPQPPAAVTSPASPFAADASAAAPASPNLESAPTAPAADPYASRRARLGSRGRARGASLSGLSMMSLGAESVTSLGGINTERTTDTAQATGMMQGSTADLIDQLNRDGPSADGHIAMSEGIDITTLQRWIQRSTGVSDDSATTTAAGAAPQGPPVCTTLQSFVNLKRNTLKLSTTLSTARPDAPSSSKFSEVDANILRAKPSLTLLPTLSYGSASTSAATSALPEPTHSLYFEYDCAAPYASVQIFIRASRKHGSWINYQPPARSSDPLSASLNPDGTPAWLAQAGPPPHVLGWPCARRQAQEGLWRRPHRSDPSPIALLRSSKDQEG